MNNENKYFGTKVRHIFDIRKFYARIFCIFANFVVSLQRKFKLLWNKSKNNFGVL